VDKLSLGADVAIVTGLGFAGLCLATGLGCVPGLILTLFGTGTSMLVSNSHWDRLDIGEIDAIGDLLIDFCSSIPERRIGLPCRLISIGQEINEGNIIINED